LATSDASSAVAPPATKKKKNKTLRTVLELVVLVLAILLAFLIHKFVYEVALVTSGSMIPTLQIQDRVLIDHRESLHNNWKRGDIVTFDSPESWGEQEVLIKRVIGLPGEIIEINDGKVYINGKILDEPYINNDSEPVGEIKKTVIPDSQYFVIGDNRNHSQDSRDLGGVEDKYIRGRAVLHIAPISKFGKVKVPRY